MILRAGVIVAAALILSKCAGTTGRGADYLANNRFDEAIEIFRNQVEADPGNYRAYLMLADAYLGKNDYNSALQAVTEALRLKPGWNAAEQRIPRIRFQQGRHLEAGGYTREAREIYESIQRNTPEFTPVYEKLIQIYRESGEDALVYGQYELLIRNHPDKAREFGIEKKLKAIDERVADLSRRAHEELDTNYYYEAAETFKQITALKPQQDEARYFHYYALGRYYLKRGRAADMPEAVRAFEEAVSAKPDAAEAYFYLAQAQAKSSANDYDTPIKLYTKVIEIAPGGKFAAVSRKRLRELTALKAKMERFRKKK